MTLSQPKLNQCPICAAEDDGDFRLLRVAYGYKLDELPLLRVAPGEEPGVYSVRTCKDCRGEFLDALETWLHGDLVDRQLRVASDDRCVPYRQNGRVVMLTRDEYARLYPGRVPHVLLHPAEELSP